MKILHAEVIKLREAMANLLVEPGTDRPLVQPLGVELVADTERKISGLALLLEQCQALLARWATETEIDEQETASNERPAAASPMEQYVTYVTLDQMSAMVSRSKRTLEKHKFRQKNPLPPPDVEGGGGKPDEWIWANVRPWLEKEFNRTLPECFPRQRPLS